MGVTVFATIGLAIWIILWALGISPVAAFLITLLLAVTGGAGKILWGHAPRRERR